MIFHLVVTTTERVTIECDSLEEAKERASVLEQQTQMGGHHGEVTTGVVIEEDLKVEE